MVSGARAFDCERGTSMSELGICALPQGDGFRVSRDPFLSCQNHVDTTEGHNIAMSHSPQTNDRATALEGDSSGRTPYIIAVLVFLCAAGVTLYFYYSMSNGMPMPGNWTMSMMWMPMGGEFAAAAIFTLMWLAMMVAMMLPSTMPMLILYRRAAVLYGEEHL